MKRFRIPVIVLCVFAIATATSVLVTPSAKEEAPLLVPKESDRVEGNVLGNPNCEPCTLICPVGKKVIQYKHCQCKCLNHPHD